MFSVECFCAHADAPLYDETAQGHRDEDEMSDFESETLALLKEQTALLSALTKTSQANRIAIDTMLTSLSTDNSQRRRLIALFELFTKGDLEFDYPDQIQGFVDILKRREPPKPEDPRSHLTLVTPPPKDD